MTAAMSSTRPVALVTDVDVCQSPAVVRVQLTTRLNPAEPRRLRSDVTAFTYCYYAHRETDIRLAACFPEQPV